MSSPAEPMDLAKLKRLRVADLKELLEARGLDTSGLKDDLVQRLHDAQTSAPAGANVGADEPDAAPEPAPAAPMDADPAPAPDADAPDEPEPEAAPEASPEPDASPEPADAPEPDAAPEPADAPADAAPSDPADPSPAEANADDPASPAAYVPPVHKRVSSAKLDRARAKLKVNSHDLDAWEVIASDAQARGVPDGRGLFEEVLAQHPTASRVWRAYAEAEIAGAPNGDRDDEAVKSIFSRCLLACPSAELWRSYTRYMVKTNDPTTEEGVQTIKAAFEYTVDAVGEDVDAGPLWLDYVTFLQAVDATHACPDAAEEHAESARMQEVRRAYQRAVSVPTTSIDALYREYDAFETKLSPTLAKALLAETKAKVDVARAALKERKKKRDALVVGGLAGPPEPSKEDKSPEGQCRLWRAFIAWEKTNPQRLEPNEDAGETTNPQLVARVTLAYEQALMSLRHFPDVWLELAAWHESEGRAEEAASVLERAREAIPTCALLNFAAADLEEARGDAVAAKAVYESLLDVHEAKANEAAEAAVADGSVASAADFAHPPMDNETLLAYVEYLRCCRRSEGSQSSRKAFMRARRAPGLRWELFVAAAQLEWRYDHNDKVARNIFELGLKTFIDDPAYVLEYADFLVGTNDVANARVLHERAAGACAEAVARARGEEKTRATRRLREFWDAYVTFEQSHGSLDAMRAAERRRHEALGEPGGGPHSAAAVVAALMSRHTFMGLRPTTLAQSQHFARQGAAVPKQEPTPRAPQYAGEREKRAAAAAAKPAKAPPKPKPPTPPAPPPAAKDAAAAKELPQLPRAPPGAGNIPKMAAPPPPPAGAGAFTHLPRELGSFASRLPDARSVGACPPNLVDAVMDVILTSDVSPDGGASAIEALNESRGAIKTGEKRKAEGDPGARSGGGGGAPLTAAANKPPPRDVFRMRQAKQARTDQAEFQ